MLELVLGTFFSVYYSIPLGVKITDLEIARPVNVRHQGENLWSAI